MPPLINTSCLSAGETGIGAPLPIERILIKFLGDFNVTRSDKAKTTKIKKEVVETMKSLGVYREEFNQIIGIYVDALYQYDLTWSEFAESGFQSETQTAAGGYKKSALAATLEELRRQILAYSDRLRINPKAYGEEVQNGKASRLDAFFENIGKL